VVARRANSFGDLSPRHQIVVWLCQGTRDQPIWLIFSPSPVAVAQVPRHLDHDINTVNLSSLACPILSPGFLNVNL